MSNPDLADLICLFVPLALVTILATIGMSFRLKYAIELLEGRKRGKFTDWFKPRQKKLDAAQKKKVLIAYSLMLIAALAIEYLLGKILFQLPVWGVLALMALGSIAITIGTIMAIRHE